MTSERWTGIYPDQYDGYELFGRLDNGDAIEVRVNGTVYRMQFEGSRYGGDNRLVVTSGDETRWYGRGWEWVQVFEALEEMQKGWEQTQVYRFRPMDSINNMEAV